MGPRDIPGEARESLLALVMIVKNEAASIRRTIESVRSFDRYTVLDTGSTDGTQDLVREAFGDLPGELHEEPFVDFGTTRNRALEIAGTKSVFTLMLSGDEQLMNAAALRAFCEEQRDGEAGAYYVRVEFGATVYDSARLARTAAGWRYEGVTHEVLVKPGVPPPTVRVPGVVIHHDLAGRTAEGQRHRWEQDRELLTRQLASHPDDTRATFYLAQTHECLDDHVRAFEYYQRRVRQGGWREEVYESLYRMGRTADAIGKPWPSVQQLYLDAHVFSPHRAEPLHAIAVHWASVCNWPLAYLFAQRASQLPFPDRDTLFVRAAVYEHEALQTLALAAVPMGNFEIAAAAAAKAQAQQRGGPRSMTGAAAGDLERARGGANPDVGLGTAG